MKYSILTTSIMVMLANGTVSAETWQPPHRVDNSGLNRIHSNPVSKPTPPPTRPTNVNNNHPTNNNYSSGVGIGIGYGGIGQGGSGGSGGTGGSGGLGVGGNQSQNASAGSSSSSSASAGASSNSNANMTDSGNSSAMLSMNYDIPPTSTIAALVAHGNVCFGSGSVGVGTSSFNISAGKTYESVECNTREDSASIAALGNITLAHEVMCNLDIVYDADRRLPLDQQRCMRRDDFDGSERKTFAVDDSLDQSIQYADNR